MEIWYKFKNCDHILISVHFYNKVEETSKFVSIINSYCKDDVINIMSSFSAPIYFYFKKYWFPISEEFVINLRPIKITLGLNTSNRVE